MLTGFLRHLRLLTKRTLRPGLVVTLCLGIMLSWLTSGCKGVIDDRIPALPVSINLGDPGMWNTYGVTGFGIYRYFILGNGMRVPSGFPYSQASATGYGGVLLIGGMDPFTTQTNVPLAYDLSCPVERDPRVRVEINIESFEAVCPECGSRYDVTMAGGAPCGGVALEGTHKYGLRRYNCRPAPMGGYIITN